MGKGTAMIQHVPLWCCAITIASLISVLDSKFDPPYIIQIVWD